MGRRDTLKSGKKCGTSEQAITRKGLAIYEMGGQIEPLTDNRWRVASWSQPNVSYVVSFGLNIPTCECEFHIKGNGRRCKHIAAIEHTLLAKTESPDVQSYYIPERKLKCPSCKKSEYIRYGTRQCKHEKKQLYKCKICNRQFRDNLGFEYRHTPHKYITLALMLYGMGVSIYECACEHLSTCGYNNPMDKTLCINSWELYRFNTTTKSGRQTGSRWEASTYPGHGVLFCHGDGPTDMIHTGMGDIVYQIKLWCHTATTKVQSPGRQNIQDIRYRWSTRI